MKCVLDENWTHESYQPPGPFEIQLDPKSSGKPICLEQICLEKPLKLTTIKVSAKIASGIFPEILKDKSWNFPGEIREVFGNIQKRRRGKSAGKTTTGI